MTPESATVCDHHHVYNLSGDVDTKIDGSRVTTVTNVDKAVSSSHQHQLVSKLLAGQVELLRWR